MAFSDLANNQGVSLNSLNSGVTQGYFVAKTTIPSSSKLATKTECDTYVQIDTTYGPFSSKSSNEIIVKGDLKLPTTNTIFNYKLYSIGANGSSMLPYHSDNGGVTWVRYSALPDNKQYNCIAANLSGQYVAVGSWTESQTIYISSDYGVTFNTISLPTGSFFAGFVPWSIDMSEDGSVIAVMVKATPTTQVGQMTVCVSTNYGASFSTSSSFISTNAAEGSVSVSGNGVYIRWYAWSIGNNSWGYNSSNSGGSWSYNGLSTNQLFKDISISYNGQYQFVVNQGTAGTGNFFISSNYGSSFISRSTLGGYLYCAMSSNGKDMVAMNNSGNLVYSTNNGVSWTDAFYGSSSPYGLLSGNTLTAPFPSTYCAYSSLSNPNYILYSPKNNFSTKYSQLVTYGVTMIRLFKKGYKF